MASIRIDRTNPGAYRVQVVRYFHRKPVVLKHIGTAHTEEELADLKLLATAWIGANPPQPQLFQDKSTEPIPTVLQNYEYQGILFTYAYELLYRLCEHFLFTTLAHPLLVDLVIMRIFEPASKLRSLMLLSKYFNITYTEKMLYGHLRRFPMLKQSVEEKITAIAKKEFGFDFSFVLFDATTLVYDYLRSTSRRSSLTRCANPGSPRTTKRSSRRLRLASW